MYPLIIIVLVLITGQMFGLNGMIVILPGIAVLWIDDYS
ncbi:hypothetical protein IGJ55_001520 [Enterococcus sp. AZ170]|nr:putative PurR-regulated permease PerM [Enterococcus ureilyticus]